MSADENFKTDEKGQAKIATPLKAGIYRAMLETKDRFGKKVTARRTIHVVDVKGAFLHGEFEDGEIIHMKIPQGFEKHFPEGSILLLKKCLYGLKQAAKAFRRQLLRAANAMGLKQSTADPCLYFKWVDGDVMD